MLRPLVGSTLLIICASQASAQNFNGTCTNVHYDGPRLVAVCLNALGVPQASSIDTRTCPPNRIANGNGNLICVSGGGGYGPPRGYGSPPPGYGGPPRGYSDDDDDDRPPPPYRRRYGY